MNSFRSISVHKKRVIILLLVVPIGFVVGGIYHRQVWEYFLELTAAFQSLETARAYIAGYGALAPVVSAILMIFQSVIAPLPAFLITFANGLRSSAFGGVHFCPGAVRCSVLPSVFLLPVYLGTPDRRLRCSSVNPASSDTSDQFRSTVWQTYASAHRTFGASSSLLMLSAIMRAGTPACDFYGFCSCHRDRTTSSDASFILTSVIACIGDTSNGFCFGPSGSS